MNTFNDNKFFSDEFEHEFDSWEDDGEGHLVMKLFMGNDCDLDKLDVSVDDNELTVKYENISENRNVRYLVQETLPEDADVETLDAEFKDGNVVFKVDKKKCEKCKKILINKK